jgi:hypothetical protein
MVYDSSAKVYVLPAIDTPPTFWRSRNRTKSGNPFENKT